MWKKFWTIAAAVLMIASIASVASAQRRGNSHRKAPDGRVHHENPGNSGQDQSPGNSGQDQSPGNGDQGEDPNGGSTGGTPDGTPPSQEAICDDLKHGTPGLFGLCIAFCEAHDCIPDYLLENPYANCKKSDGRILDNYNRKMREGDPDMPCIPSSDDESAGVACPCWSREQLAMFPYNSWLSNVSETSLSYEIDGYFEEWDEDDNEVPFLDCSQDQSYIGETVILTDGTAVHFDIGAINGDCDGMYCSGAIFCEKDDDPDAACPDGVETSNYTPEEITDEEYEACAQQIRDLEPFLY